MEFINKNFNNSNNKDKNSNQKNLMDAQYHKVKKKLDFSLKNNKKTNRGLTMKKKAQISIRMKKMKPKNKMRI